MIDGATSLPRPEMDAVEARTRARCPECGERPVHRGGCIECNGCGYSTCG